MSYKTIIGLEIHSELSTNSKIFCSCTTEYGGDPNTHCCPICLGLPGSLPVLNEKVVEYGIKAGLAFNSNIANHTKMDRKNYYYPDLVKGYQISQYDKPLCEGGYIEVDTENGKKKINLTRIHIEEDTGKSIHSKDGGTLLDYNRAGVPLIEIVSEPDMNSPEEAKQFLEKLKSVLQYIEVSDCKMEEGSLRCDVNINIVDEETGKKSTITEIKNLNSFKSAVKAMEFEQKRHIELLEKGEDTVRETRRYDDLKGETISMRTKEDASDYRYFPEPDIVDMEISNEWIENIRKSLPELPEDKMNRFIKQYDLPEYDAEVLTASKNLALFYEDTVSHSVDFKTASNLIMGDILRRLKDEDMEVEDMRFSSKEFADLIKIIDSGKISNKIGKKVLREMFEEGKDPNKIVKEKGLIQINDEGEIEKIVDETLDENPESIEDYKNGKDRALGFLVGQVMKKTRGKANPGIVNKLISKKLNS
ncbi:Asp-tRNA(Asn)/Glu-tRNA(Gln) amidotransferase subunit GatB [Senegalia massiliensis]|uniref:Aspartyl/glutamyl-tRNA(Asn/Gln) amidotransferase subunit B n=1 Tax=Senegalia massiliensis TaxID=1720316 RepID=A0A845R407_9CLOT|nr:Asp-tRNA(Asn)/Glu-tRNA(Gln) amidotransferase subunit GatB [Senegalia massiliensis]NBI07233.1 Asp-tRNA(Asn)/Glu-tRNA(Gln) amidotransferase subunit GatB [Senegalia massiliensis]